MAFDDNPTKAIGQWIGSIYHRTPLLDPRMRDFGYGNATGCDTIDLGEGLGSTTPDSVIVSYPYDGPDGRGPVVRRQRGDPHAAGAPGGVAQRLPDHDLHGRVEHHPDDRRLRDRRGRADRPPGDDTSVGAGVPLRTRLVLYGNVPLTSKTTYRVHVAGTRHEAGRHPSSTTAQFDVNFAFTTQ